MSVYMYTYVCTYTYMYIYVCVCFCLSVSTSGQLWDTINYQKFRIMGIKREYQTKDKENIFSQVTAENLITLQKDVHVGQAMYLSPDTQYKERYSQQRSVFKH